MTNYKNQLKIKSLKIMLLFVLTQIMLTVNIFADNYDAKKSSTKVINGIINVALLIAIVVGILLIIVGVIKFVVAHANEDGPGQQKAAMLLATGIALLLLGGIFKALNLADIVSNAVQDAGTLSLAGKAAESTASGG